MNQTHLMIFAVLGITLILFLWNKIRYDLVAFMALIVCVIIGIVPFKTAFSGFGNPATITVALVLILSKAFYNSGFSKLISKWIQPFITSSWTHILILSLFGAVLSAFMNNVAALALLMPVAIQSSQDAGRSPSIILMPLSFATILGGMATLIGTPPNILISAYRQEVIGQPFQIFDFAPVGTVIAFLGVIFLAFVGWRFLPKEKKEQGVQREFSAIEKYMLEVKITKTSILYHQAFNFLESSLAEKDIKLLALSRKKTLIRRFDAIEKFNLNDILILEGDPQELVNLTSALKLELIENNNGLKSLLLNKNYKIVELIVTQDSEMVGKTVEELRLDKKYDLKLLGVSRQGKSHRGRLKSFVFKVGDVLMLYLDVETITSVCESLKCISLREREIIMHNKWSLWLVFITFSLAIVSTILDFLPFQISLGIVVITVIMTKIISAHEVYKSISWPVIILIGSLIPLGEALGSSGAAQALVNLFFSMYPSLPPELALFILFVLIMLLTDVLNNAAAVIIMAPIALNMAQHFSVNPDPFLMTVAIAASSSFLTPIGHHNNVLIMGPGGYSFRDYWRVGLPLEILITLIAVPMVLMIWPF
jgi:di/tricarboxylate transporter